LNRLITTFDEVPPLSTEVDVLPAIHIAGNDGVSFKTCTAEVFRPVSIRKAEAFQKRDPQGLRRPRFSFFIFTCQTARGRNPSLILMRVFRNLTRRRIATGNCRLLIHSSKVRSLTGAVACLGQWPKPRRAQWPGYRPGFPRLSTVIVNKSSHRASYFLRREEASIFEDFTPHLSHNAATFWLMMYVLNRRDAFWGLPAIRGVRDRRSREPVAFSCRPRSIERFVPHFVVRDFGCFIGP